MLLMNHLLTLGHAILTAAAANLRTDNSSLRVATTLARHAVEHANSTGKTQRFLRASSHPLDLDMEHNFAVMYAASQSFN